jgi:cytochrome c oxidase accessory protein FixG
MNAVATKVPPNDPRAANQTANLKDYRDHLSTADKKGRRQWLYPRKVSGRWYRWRTYVSWALLAIMFIGPFIRINGNPLLLVNVVERKFAVAGQMFWPQDGVILTFGLLLFITSIIVFTTAFGRLWCGWTCPQTLLMEMVFRKIEYAIEGDAHEQRALNKAPWTALKLVKKVGKQLIFFGLSFLIGNTLLSYIIGTEQLYQIVADDPRNHLTGLTFMLLFTLVFYAIFARFREQACTYICPYGRFQATMIDENTMVVAYDYKRGEKRAHWRRQQPVMQRQAEGHGDCINCRQCVTVCPTGIDIRDGTQMECVHCTACIDACDAVMTRIGRPRGLIRYASLDSIERGKLFAFTPRMAVYTVVISVLAGVLAYLVFTRSDVEATMLRAQGQLFQTTEEGRISNLYTVKVINKTTHDVPVELKLENVAGALKFMAGHDDIDVAAGKLAETSVLVELTPAALRGTSTPLTVGVYSGGKKLQTIKTTFIGPRKEGPAP